MGREFPELLEVVSIAATYEAAEREDENTALVAAQRGGGCARIDELLWREKLGLVYSEEKVQELRYQLLQQPDVNKVEKALRNHGFTTSSILNKQLLEIVKHYNFDSPGIDFTPSNYYAWKRLADGKGLIDDVRYIVHEIAEVREFQRIQQKTGFDFMGAAWEKMKRRQKTQWQSDFEKYYMQAHSKALEHEYSFIAEQVSNFINHKLPISLIVAAAVDPSRDEARLYMLVEGKLLSEHSNFEYWKQRGNEMVELSQSKLVKLGLYKNPTLAELVHAVKRVKLR